MTLLRNTFALQQCFKKIYPFCVSYNYNRYYATIPDHLKIKIQNGPSLKDFIVSDPSYKNIETEIPIIPYIDQDVSFPTNRKVFFEVFGCQMNSNDTEIVWSILKKQGFMQTKNENEADVLLIMTCAIREGAETKVWHRLDHIRGIKRRRSLKKNSTPVKIGILGCMAERLKEKLIHKEAAVDIVAGPDSYKDLPRLLTLTKNNQTAVNVLLSLDETYADVLPVQLNQDSISAYISIMRGCDNMCTYCIVPFTRGRERSRPLSSILTEVKHLSDQGIKEITLLGQNVNSYRDLSETSYGGVETNLVKGFKTVYKPKKGGLRFADLLDKVSLVDPEMRIRFTSPHPKDFPNEVLQIISERDNICNMLHLPAQSGSSSVLERMRRGYTREAYLELIDRVRQTLPNVGISSDFICGFCGETEEEFLETLSLIDIIDYNMAFLFPYSMREKTTAHRRYTDDVPVDIKKRRHMQMVDLYRTKIERLNRKEIGNIQLVLVEGKSKRSALEFSGRNENNIKVIFPQTKLKYITNNDDEKHVAPGDYIAVELTDANSQVFKGKPLFHCSISSFKNDFMTHNNTASLSVK